MCPMRNEQLCAEEKEFEEPESNVKGWCAGK
jgi:hypothetical protein